MYLSYMLAVVGVISPWLVRPLQTLDQISFKGFTPSTYLNSTGLTDLVQWDGYSLFVKGQRIYLYSGEIHRTSLPGLPILQIIHTSISSDSILRSTLT